MKIINSLKIFLVSIILLSSNLVWASKWSEWKEISSQSIPLNFNSIGYKMGQYVIPDSLESKQYSLIQILDRDTILLPVTTVKVWPTYDQFKKAFLAVEVPDNDLVRAQKNLDAEGIREKAINLALGSVGNQDLMQQNYNSRLYYAGQVQPNNFLNPIAWAKFIKAWKEGKLGRYR